MRPDGNCRTCMVEIKGERVLAPSCCRYPTDGMEVDDRQPARRALARRWSSSCCRPTCPRRLHARLRARLCGKRWLASASRASPRAQQPAADLSHPAMAVNLDACIQCKRCVRACREEQVNDVIGYAFRGAHSKIVFDLDDPMGESTCVACGECVQACPTGALMPARDAYLVKSPTSRSSRCARTAASAASSPTTSRTTRSSTSRAATARRTTSACASRAATASTTSHHPHRLTKPLIRKPGVAEDARTSSSIPTTAATCSAKPRGKRRSTLAGGTLKRIRDTHGGKRAGRLRLGQGHATKRPTCSRSWCAPASARTTSTTARACATRRASRR